MFYHNISYTYDICIISLTTCEYRIVIYRGSLRYLPSKTFWTP